MGNQYGFQEVEQEYLRAMGGTIRITKRSGATNDYGEQAHGGTVYEIPCHITDEQTALRGAGTGENWVSIGKAYLGWLVPWLSVADKFEVPNLATGWRETKVGVVRVEYGPDGPHHQELFFGAFAGVKGGMLE